VFTLRRRVLGCATLAGAPVPAPPSAYLLSGIARPERFAGDARGLGVDVLRHRAFADHHRFSAAELERAVAEARALGAAAILTTAKDAVRLPPRAWDVPVLVLRISAEVAEVESFRARLLAAAARAA
jgi:tetraacyldisaccharide 4'-kinase